MPGSQFDVKAESVGDAFMVLLDPTPPATPESFSIKGWIVLDSVRLVNRLPSEAAVELRLIAHMPLSTGGQFKLIFSQDDRATIDRAPAEYRSPAAPRRISMIENIPGRAANVGHAIFKVLAVFVPMQFLDAARLADMSLTLEVRDHLSERTAEFPITNDRPPWKIIRQSTPLTIPDETERNTELIRLMVDLDGLINAMRRETDLGQVEGVTSAERRDMWLVNHNRFTAWGEAARRWGERYSPEAILMLSRGGDVQPGRRPDHLNLPLATYYRDALARILSDMTGTHIIQPLVPVPQPRAQLPREESTVTLRDLGRHLWDPSEHAGGVFVIFTHVAIAHVMKHREHSIHLRLQVELADGGWPEPRLPVDIPLGRQMNWPRHPELNLVGQSGHRVITLMPDEPTYSCHVAFFFSDFEWNRWGGQRMLDRNRVTLKAQDVRTGDITNLLIDRPWSDWLELERRN